MNIGRIVLGGLLAGLILNIGEGALHAVVLADAMTATYERLNVALPEAPGGLVWLAAMTFAQGILGVWLYAAMRPRLGAGPKTAVIAGLVVWALSAVYGAIYLHAGFIGVFTNDIVWTPVAWGLVEFPLAMLAGAKLYRE